MSDSSAPRAVENVLGALGADTEFSEGVIGDLAEEYAIREQWDGRASARRWYYREAMRVTPHLLRGWWRGLRWSDAGALANDVAWASICAVTVNYFLALALIGVVRVLLRALGVHIVGEPLGLALLLTVPLNLWIGGFGAYLAARFHKRAPMPGALVFTLLWVVVFVVLVLVRPAEGEGLRMWAGFANFGAFTMGTLLGGVLRAVRGRAAKVGAS